MEQKKIQATSYIAGLIETCRVPYQGKTPLIMLDTFDGDLAEAVALSEQLVPLLREEDESGLKEQLYYDFMGAWPEDLARCANLFFSGAALAEVQKLRGQVDGFGLPGVFVLPLLPSDERKDHARLMEQLRAYVRDYARCADNQSPLRNTLVLLYGDVALLPEDLLLYTEIVEVPYPRKLELLELAEIMSADCPGEPVSRDTLRDLSNDMGGFSFGEARRLLQRLLWVDDANGEALIHSRTQRKQLLLAAKKQALLQNGGLLELQKDGSREDKGQPGTDSADATAPRLAGMGGYQKWAERKKPTMTVPEQYLLDRGTLPPKGVLLCGIPGCGKSEAARILGREWGLPLVRLNIDQLMAGKVGESERNLRMALRQAEGMAPCIVQIDEIDKGFSGAGSGQSGDSGTFKRMFGRLLNWMQDNKRACFIFASANDIGLLPPEFFRKGRFDERFSVFMPTHKECMDNFAEQMRRADQRRTDEARNRGLPKPAPLFAPECYAGKTPEDCLQKIMALFTATGKFLTGADIEDIVKNALLRLPAHMLLTPLSDKDWLRYVDITVSDATMSTYGSSEGNRDQITACCVRLLRGNFVPASDPDQVLFHREQYHVGWTEQQGQFIPTVSYTGEAPEQPYDQALYAAVLERFKRIAAGVERQELQRVAGDGKGR